MHNDDDLESNGQGICNGRAGDTEGTRAKGIAEEIVERLMIEADCSMNTQGMVCDGLI